MHSWARSLVSRPLAVALALSVGAARLACQSAPAPGPDGWTTPQDHADMMRQLGITKLRPGASGRTGPDVANPANYDPAKANPFPDLPELLVAKDRTNITTSELWWKQRRPEIVEDFERPPLNHGLLDGALAWRQHAGGHEDRSNMKHFIAWANQLIGHPPPQR